MLLFSIFYCSRKTRLNSPFDATGRLLKFLGKDIERKNQYKRQTNESAWTQKITTRVFQCLVEISTPLESFLHFFWRGPVHIWAKVFSVSVKTFRQAHEISPYYENNMKVTLRLYETKSIPVTKWYKNNFDRDKN